MNVSHFSTLRWLSVLAVYVSGLVLIIGSESATESAGSSFWTWVSGSNTVNQSGTYGTQGVAAVGNVPGARANAVSWIDASGHRWLHGGSGYDSAGAYGSLNDLWRYDGTLWTWVSGSNTVNQSGTYGMQGVAAGSNVPGARSGAVSWIDSSGHFWLHGGSGYDSVGSNGRLNDLWRFDGTNWTWMSGSNTVNQSGSYGTQGVANAANVPGARSDAISWRDTINNLWLFGGIGRDSGGTENYLNDLWKFDGANWTWISGSDIVHQNGVYGAKGVAAAGNVPGSRYSSVSWIDATSNLWLFGGIGRDSVGTVGRLNDLWRFDGTYWTWVSGSNNANQSGTYGTKGVAAVTNVPGARYSAASWIGSNGHFWLFGDHGYDSAGSLGRLNDLWRFDGTNWTWMSGSNTVNPMGVYGSQGTAAASNVPGARIGAVSWKDASGGFWMFGGDGYDSAGSLGWLNDLWRYQP